MTATDKTTLKGYFETGDIPTEAQFATLIDSALLSFDVEDYGAAAGNSAAVNTAAIQAAIDAASVKGGIVHLRDDYNIETAGAASIAGASNNYALRVNANNVYVVGPGSLVLATAPTITTGSFIALAFGTDQNNIIRRCGAIGVTIDATALSAAELLALSGARVGASIGFYGCSEFIANSNVIKNGWGFNGALQTIVGSEYGVITGNRIIGARKTGIWVDGCRYTTIAHNMVYLCLSGGIYAATNADTLRNPQWLSIDNNIIRLGSGFAIAISSGEHCSINSNKIFSNGVGNGVVVQVRHPAGFGDWETNYLQIKNNLMVNVSGGAANAIDVSGVDVSAYDGAPVLAHNIFAEDNDIVGDWLYGVYLRQSTQDSYFIKNTINITGTDFGDDGSPSISGNTTTPNY